MKNKKFLLCIALLLGFGLTGLQAQKAILANGSVALGTGGSVCYSIGQIVYTSIAGTNGSVSQGVQQPYEIFVGLEEAKNINLNCSVYPNPTRNVLTLKVENLTHSTFTYSLYDMNGKLLENNKFKGDETSIDLSKLVPSNYFLKVTDNTKEMHTFKIVKN